MRHCLSRYTSNLDLLKAQRVKLDLEALTESAKVQEFRKKSVPRNWMANKSFIVPTSNTSSQSTILNSNPKGSGNLPADKAYEPYVDSVVEMRDPQK